MEQCIKKLGNHSELWRIMVMSILLMLFAAGQAFAKDEKSIKLQKEEKTENTEPVADRIRPEFGASGSYIVPFGRPAPYLGLGFGASLYFDLAPYDNNVFGFRLGITSAFMNFSSRQKSNITATLMIFPEYAHMKFAFQFAFGLRLAMKIGGGISVALLEKKEYKFISSKKNAYDPTAIGGVEIGYTSPSNKHLYIFIHADYYSIFEQLRGQFLAASFGFAYKI